MTPSRPRQIEEILQAALALPEEERARYIAEVCAGNEELKNEVEKLLGENEDLINEDEDPMIGQRIGAYKIEREIGRGGMGAVYEAVRADGEFKHRVAIKIVKRGMDTDFILKRFRNERQILAALDHPNIAHLLSGGTTDDGRPFFVMEFIAGKPLYQYCDEHRMGIQKRLRLFTKICDAVQYAHEKMIIHRDLKPTNILVSSNGTPTLLDFGISKLLDPDLISETTPQTATSVRMMTVEYASPEQVRGETVTFLSDVYSLGVLLYELLTGHKPYLFRNRMQHEIARAILEDEPEHPSQTVNRREQTLPLSYVDRDAITVTHLSDMRAENPESLQKELKGNLDNITLKALRKEPSERYQSVAELREDIMNHLNEQPISAPFYSQKPDETKSIIVDNAGTELQTETVTDEKEEKIIAVLPFKLTGTRTIENTDEEYLSIGLADALITRLSNQQRFILRPTSSILRYNHEIDPLVAGRELDVNYVLDGRIKRAGERLRVSVQLLDMRMNAAVWANQFDERFTDVLELEDTISEKVADALLPQLTTQERLQLKKRGTNNPQAHEAYLRGRHFWNQFTASSLPKAIESFQAAIALDPNYALPYVGVADFYNWGSIYGILPPSVCYPKAREAAKRALELDSELGEAYAALGLIHEDMWEWEAAEECYKRAIELNPNHPHAHEWYSSMLVSLGKFDEGIKAIARAEELDPLTPRTKALVAWSYYQTRDFSEGLAKAEQIIELDEFFPQGYFQAGNILPHLGRAQDAVEIIKKGSDLIPDPLPKYQLCFALVAANRYEEAKAVADELLERSTKEYIKPYFIAMCFLAIGETDKYFEWIEKSFDEHDPWIIWTGTEPKLDSIRNHPRFQKLFERMNHPLAKQRIVENVETDSEKSVAVLPFKLTGIRKPEDTGDEYLCVGLADTLITRLSNVNRLIVRPTSSVLRFNIDSADPFTIGKELGVDFIVDGNIRRVGEQIRISVQLLNVKEHAMRWASQFDEKFTDVLQVEDSISRQVAEVLIPRLTGSEQNQLNKRGTDNPEAFEAYLRGRYYWNTFSQKGLAKAFEYYSRAISIAPDYALAYSGMADYYNWIGINAVQPFAETSSAAKEYAIKAITFDPTLAEGYSALGFAVLAKDFDWKAAESHYKRALNLKPNYAIGHLWYCQFLTVAGRFDEAVKEGERAYELDSLTPIIQLGLSWTYFYARRYDESIKAARRLVANEPNYGIGYVFMSLALFQTGRYDEAIEARKKCAELLGRTPYTLNWLAAAYAADKQVDKATELLKEIEILSAKYYVSPYLTATVYCNLGEKERALELLEKALEIRDGRLLWLGVDPQFDSLRGNERFENILRATNNPVAVEQNNTGTAS